MENKNKRGVKRSRKGQLVLDALAKFPKSSKKAVANYLHETYPELFSDVENARGLIKAYTTPSGDISADSKVDRSANTFSHHNPFGLPEAIELKEKTYRLPKVNNRILWVSDIHFPNHDQQALTVALKYGKDNDANCIVIGGDLLDNTPFTSFLHPPFNKNDVKDWFDMAEGFLAILRREFPNALIVWIEGNHDQWYERYLIKHAPVLFGDEYFELPNRLNLTKYGVKYLKQNVICKAGKLDLLHGHTIVKGVFSPVNAARGAFNKAKSSLMIGHCHQTSEHTETNLRGDIITCFSTGCLCTLNPDYDPHNTKHNHGFAFIEIGDKGHFKVVNKRIFNGELL